MRLFNIERTTNNRRVLKLSQKNNYKCKVKNGVYYGYCITHKYYCYVNDNPFPKRKIRRSWKHYRLKQYKGIVYSTTIYC